jgi:hypothetical protein
MAHLDLARRADRDPRGRGHVVLPLTARCWRKLAQRRVDPTGEHAGRVSALELQCAPPRVIASARERQRLDEERVTFFRQFAVRKGALVLGQRFERGEAVAASNRGTRTFDEGALL